MAKPVSSHRTREVARLFLRLGLTAFGGPASHIALMREEVVSRRGWVSDQEFLDLLGGANLIPGPTSTELAILLGYRQAGFAGLLAASLFILPAVVMVLALAWAYVRFGSVPAVEWVLYGIKPVVVAVIAIALWGLARTALHPASLALLSALTLVLFFLGVSPLLALAGSGVFMLLFEEARRATSRPPAAALATIAAGAATKHVAVSLDTLFLTFLKIGAIIYGSGYVLLAFLQDDFVHGLGWLTTRQVLDAVAVGQITPGPVFTTATFVGYIVAGVPGAMVATVAIFLPSFFLVPVVSPWIPRLRSSPTFRGFLDGVNASALGLMAAVTLLLARSAIVDVPSAVLFIASLAILARTRLNPAWILLGGAVLGAAYKVALP
jgi:chromate transporter